MICSVPEAILVSLWMLLSHHIPILSVSGIREIQNSRVITVLIIPWELCFLTLKVCIDQSGQHQLVRPLGIFTRGTTNFARCSGSKGMTEEVKEQHVQYERILSKPKIYIYFYTTCSTNLKLCNTSPFFN